jgi:ketosteroid isomerase-like protein
MLRSSLSSDGKIIHGFEALREQQIKWWKNGKSDVVYTEQGKADIISLDKHTALVTQQLASHRTMPDGRPRENKFVVTSIFTKFPAGWRVTYCHESHTP